MRNPYQPPVAQVEKDLTSSAESNAGRRPPLLTMGFYCAMAVFIAELGITLFAGLGGHSLPIWLAIAALQASYAVVLACAFSGYRWARITLVVCSLGAAGVAVMSVLALMRGDMSALTMGLGAVAQLLAVATLFAPSSRAWFRSR